MQEKEIKELVISAVVLALAFAIALSGGLLGALSGIDAFPFIFLIALVTVSLSFIFHEMGHRFFAKRYGMFAEFRMWTQGLMMALVFSLIGFVFAAPGAVYIYPRSDLWGHTSHISMKQNALISAAGPAVNFIFAIIFMFFGFLFPVYSFIAVYGMTINSWLALFNLLPFGPLDGLKILAWNKLVWAGMFVFSIILYGAAVMLF